MKGFVEFPKMLYRSIAMKDGFRIVEDSREQEEALRESWFTFEQIQEALANTSIPMNDGLMPVLGPVGRITSDDPDDRTLMEQLINDPPKKKKAKK